jgi:protein-S-isoprenylcysteine O-methyltransferase Ste14
MSWVAAQTALMAAIVASWFFPPWVGQAHALQVAGGVMVAAGVALLLAARTAMGSSFTVRPQPRAAGQLVTRGPFRLVRHPIYLGALLCFAGGSLFRSWTGLGLTAGLAVLWGAKARVEERYLSDRFAEYAAYRRRVRYRLVPFLY